MPVVGGGSPGAEPAHRGSRASWPDRADRRCGSPAIRTPRWPEGRGASQRASASRRVSRPKRGWAIAQPRRACRISSALIAVHPRTGAANIPFDHEVDLLPALEPDWTCPIVPGAGVIWVLNAELRRKSGKPDTGAAPLASACEGTARRGLSLSSSRGGSYISRRRLDDQLGPSDPR